MEIKDFIEKVVGSNSVSLTEDGWQIKPFGINRDGNYISFKGERIQNFYGTDIEVVKAIVDGMNYGYGMAIKDVTNNSDVLQGIKPFKFL